MKKAVKSQDPLILKMMRNLSTFDGPNKLEFLDHIDQIAAAVVESPDEDYMVEALGILGQLAIPDFNFEKLLSDYDMLDWMNERLLPAAADDDVVLLVVILLGTVLADESCAQQVCSICRARFCTWPHHARSARLTVSKVFPNYDLRHVRL